MLLSMHEKGKYPCFFQKMRPPLGGAGGKYEIPAMH